MQGLSSPVKSGRTRLIAGRGSARSGRPLHAFGLRNYGYTELRTCVSTDIAGGDIRPPGPGLACCPGAAVRKQSVPHTRIYGTADLRGRPGHGNRRAVRLHALWSRRCNEYTTGRAAPDLRICGSTDLRAGCNRDHKVCSGLGSASGSGASCRNPTTVTARTLRSETQDLPRVQFALTVPPLLIYGSTDSRMQGLSSPVKSGRTRLIAGRGSARSGRPLHAFGLRNYGYTELRTCVSTDIAGGDIRPPGPGLACCPGAAVRKQSVPHTRIYGTADLRGRPGHGNRRAVRLHALWSRRCNEYTTGRAAPDLRICGSTDLRAGCNRDHKVCSGLGSASGSGASCRNPTTVTARTLRSETQDLPRVQFALTVPPLLIYGSTDSRMQGLSSPVKSGRTRLIAGRGSARSGRPLHAFGLRNYGYTELRTCVSTDIAGGDIRPPGPGLACCPGAAVRKQSVPHTRIYGTADLRGRPGHGNRRAVRLHALWSRRCNEYTTGRAAPDLRICGSTDLRAGCNRDHKVCSGLGSASGSGASCRNPTTVTARTLRSETQDLPRVQFALTVPPLLIYGSTDSRMQGLSSPVKSGRTRLIAGRGSARSGRPLHAFGLRNYGYTELRTCVSTSPRRVRNMHDPSFTVRGPPARSACNRTHVGGSTDLRICESTELRISPSVPCTSRPARED
ncbi:hypothetical protein SAMN04490239_0034 [Rhodococcus koreensis]|uniref:Uncharacterized protein n=1 Tax=Rhodococcus koreensis TaxID=99653 RepID=A0A1H4I505_9NOCA|nr:hypothetical protein SAMN04490239_0034 [Rhodococcus koreensis]